MATAVVVEPSPSMSVAWMVSVYLGAFWGEKESGRPLRVQFDGPSAWAFGGTALRECGGRRISFSQSSLDSPTHC